MRLMRPIFLVVLIFTSLLPITASAIVNVEGMHLNKPKEGFSGAVDIGLDGNAGNSESFSASLGTLLQWHQSQLTHKLSLSHEYGESFNVKSKDNSFIHLRRIQDITARTAWELFGQLERDEFARLKYRGLLGSGARFSLTEKESKHVVYLGAGGFYSEEKITDGGLADEGVTSNVRGNFYLLIKMQLTDTLFIGSTTYIQPDVSDPKDVRALEVGQLGIKVADNVNLSFNAIVKHDSRPPQSVKKTDVSIKTGLNYSF